MTIQFCNIVSIRKNIESLRTIQKINCLVSKNRFSKRLIQIAHHYTIYYGRTRTVAIHSNRRLRFRSFKIFMILTIFYDSQLWRRTRKRVEPNEKIDPQWLQHNNRRFKVGVNNDCWLKIEWKFTVRVEFSTVSSFASLTGRRHYNCRLFCILSNYSKMRQNRLDKYSIS